MSQQVPQTRPPLVVGRVRAELTEVRTGLLRRKVRAVRLQVGTLETTLRADELADLAAGRLGVVESTAGLQTFLVDGRPDPGTGADEDLHEMSEHDLALWVPGFPDGVAILTSSEKAALLSWARA